MNAQEIVEWIDEFEEDCEAKQYTETTEAWNIIIECRSYLKLLPETD